MVVTGMRCGGVLGLHDCVAVRKIGRKFGTIVVKRKDFDKNGKIQQQSFTPFRISKSIIARVAVGMFGLGFIDAGYSGDWSRIGVITPENEELLKVESEGEGEQH